MVTAGSIKFLQGKFMMRNHRIMNIKVKMIKLNSNSVAVDELKDVKKAEKLNRDSNRNLIINNIN